MIKRIEALGYRCLRDIQQSMGRFHILVGPNASGKSTFLDVIRFLGELIQPRGVEAAIQNRAQDWRDLLWKSEGDSFELAVEVEIPQDKRERLENSGWDVCRYQVKIGQESDDEPVGILAENLLLKRDGHSSVQQRSFFPELEEPRETILERIGKRGTKVVVNKVHGGNDNFYDETGAGWDHAFKLGPQKSALGNLPEDETKFPVSTWFKSILMEGIEFLHLDSEAMRLPSPPGRGIAFQEDGSNLPWVVRNLEQKHQKQLALWLDHVCTSLPDVAGIETIVREEDRHCYLRVRYHNGLKVPSWGLSDGTLRLFALTLLLYLPDVHGIFLIEEPENGIHPRAVETIYESLSSVYGAQVLVATHSPVLLSVAKLEELLCFVHDPQKGTGIVSGPEHPKLKNWRHETDLGTLFASGVLG